MTQFLEKIGNYKTLRSAAREKCVTGEALFSWATRHNVQLYKVGNTLFIDENDVQKYQTRKKAN